ncbi:zinc finger protein [Macleaya cordata]|uniref:Protein FAR1-RELATED SEQUENCE n=1 Tax=Macleaya cordata TaxID=56857 RepID=A0A200Q700_MACCD|nr:zinc finger protein [Macleaya cordata]
MKKGRTIYDFEKQAGQVYTLAKFKEFQDELTAGTTYCEVMETRRGGYVTEYEIREDVVIGDHKKRKMFLVSWRREECEYKCSYNLFEFKRLLCRHIIKVFIRNDVPLIPDKYILRRWRKDVSRSHTKFKVNYNGWCATEEHKRFNKLCSAFNKVADAASTDVILYNHVMEKIDTLSKELDELKLSNEAGQSTSKLCSNNTIDGEASASQNILDPIPAHTKGQSRFGQQRLVSRLEKEVDKSRRKYERVKKKEQDGQVNKSKQKIGKGKKQRRQCLIHSNEEPTPNPTPIGFGSMEDCVSLHYGNTQEDYQSQLWNDTYVPNVPVEGSHHFDRPM